MVAPAVAVLDANVLIAHNTRHLLLIGADLGLYEVRWSLEILAEADKHLNRRAARAGVARSTVVAKLVGNYRESLLVDVTSGARPLTRTDAKDWHVVYAAVASCASHIVTNDENDFDDAELANLGLTAVSSDTFLASHYTADAYVTAVGMIAAPRRNPPQTPDQLSLALIAKHPLLVSEFGHTFTA